LPCPRLLKRAEEFEGIEWWLVDLVCRQGLDLHVAARKVGPGVEEAEAVWRGLTVPR
jgi:hypothetical protein